MPVTAKPVHVARAISSAWRELSRTTKPTLWIGVRRLAQASFAVFVSGGSPENPITHSNWEGKGVQPDVAVPSADALTRAEDQALQRLLNAAPQGPDATELRWLLADMHA